MKKILGLDIGVSSVGFALIEKNEKDSKILKTGVRIIVEDPDFHGNFYEGKNASKNKARTTKRSIRRNNQRFKLRRDKLLSILKKNGMMPDHNLLHEITGDELFKLRALAVREKLTLQQLGRILIHLSQKRGFLSNRKAQNENDNSEYLKRVGELDSLVTERTIGEFWHSFKLFKRNERSGISQNLIDYFEKRIHDEPDFRIRENIFSRKSYMAEFDKIWGTQSKFYPDILTGSPENEKSENKNTLYHLLRNETIYYQRPLKSQKGLVSNCSFEKYHKVAPKSSPLFQVFRIWQQINNLEIKSSEGEIFLPTPDDRIKLFESLHNPAQLNKRGELTYSKVLKLLNFPNVGFYLNYELLEGNKTYLKLLTALKEAQIENPEEHLRFDPLNTDEKSGLWALWHITYSLENEDDVVNALMKYFPFDADQALAVAQSVGYTSDYGSLSSRAIRKLLPQLQQGLNYFDACKKAGYENPEHLKNEELNDNLNPLYPNELRNPVVEQILNQVTNVVNKAIDTYGKPDEVRVELARELKNNAKRRARLTLENRNLRRYNDAITQKLKTEHGFKRVSNLDLLRYRLWEETNRKCLYSGKTIGFTQLYNGETHIEHIIPISRSFNDAMSNKIIVFAKENTAKDQMTAFDYMKSKTAEDLQRYTEDVNRLFQEGYSRLDSSKPVKISRAKWQNLLCKGEDISGDFIQRQLKDSQYIAKETIRRLKKVFPKVTTTTGSVTDFLREKWELNHLIQELNIEKYRSLGLVEKITVKDAQGNEKEIDRISGWSKRDDHRHHAVDALIIAFTSQGIIQKLNNLNQEYERYKDLKESQLSFPMPMNNFRQEARKSLENILISFKKPNSKVLTKNMNKVKKQAAVVSQQTWVPRGSLHEDTVLGKIKWYRKVNLNKKFDVSWLGLMPDSELKNAISAHLEAHDNDATKAFKKTFTFGEKEVTEVAILDSRFVKRVAVSENMTSAQISKIIDKRLRQKIEERVSQYGGIKAAFKDYLRNPVWLDAANTIPVKSVRIFDEGNLASVRDGYVYTKGNHHALIYEDDKGNYTDKVVSFWEAVETAIINLREKGSIYPVIDRSDKPGLRFRFSMQINDLFVFGLNPEEIDFLNPQNLPLISKNLFRVQTISSGDYRFRHHLETTLESNTDFAYKRIQSNNKLKLVHKVRLDNLGNIIKVGE